MSCFSIYSLYPPDHPPGIERRQNLRFFKQKVVTSTKFRNFVWNHSGKEAMGSFLHIIPHTPPPLEKRDPEICVFVTKSEGYKNKISKFCLVPLRQRGYEFGSLYIPHKPPSLGKEGQRKFHGYKRRKNRPLLPEFITIIQLKSAIGLANFIAGHSTPSTNYIGEGGRSTAFYRGGRGDALPPH